MLIRFNTSCVDAPHAKAVLDDAGFPLTVRKGLIFDLVPYLCHVRTLYEFGELLQLAVHLLELGADGEDELDALLLGHLLVETDLADRVKDAHTAVDDVHIDVVAVAVERYGNGIDGSIADLSRQFLHVLRQVIDLVVEAIDLCGIGDDVAESTEVLVELPLVVLRGVDLRLEPDMTLCLRAHRTQLCVVLVLCQFRVTEYHRRECGVDLRL